eukprot:5200308-Pleurochrysis_carterae.AAC.4
MKREEQACLSTGRATPSLKSALPHTVAFAEDVRSCSAAVALVRRRKFKYTLAGFSAVITK